MSTNLEDKIGRVQTNVKKALAATAAKGVTVPADANSDDLESLILAIENGTASPEDLTELLNTQESKLTALLESLDGKAAGGGDGSVPVVMPLNVTENGTYNVPVGIDGFAPVNVNVNKGVELPELDNPGSEADLMAGKQLIDADGNPVTGTFTVEEEVNTLAEKLAELNTILDEKAAGGGGEIETCTLTVRTNGAYIEDMRYSTYQDGRISLISREVATDMVFENVVKNSIMTVCGAFTAFSVNDGLDRIFDNLMVIVCSVSGENAELILSA